MPQTVELRHAYRLLNHGPTVLVSVAHEGRRALMAAAWAMPLDFEPPKVAVVIDKSTYTRGLVEAAGGFALNLPCAAQADLACTVGHESSHEVGDKFGRHGIAHFAGTATPHPLVEGCVGWLECRLLPEPQLQGRHDLFLAEVVAAQADPRVFSNGRWHFGNFAPEHAALRTLHHVAGGHFLLPGDGVQGQRLEPAPR